MVTEPEKPAETPVVVAVETPKPVTAEQPVQPTATAATVTVKAKDDADDTAELTMDEVVEAGKRAIQTAKHGLLKPVYRLGRRYLRSAQSATEAFFDGVVNEKQGKK